MAEVSYISITNTHCNWNVLLGNVSCDTVAYMNPSAGTLFQFLCAGLKALSIKNLTSGEMKARNSAFLFDGKNFHV